MSTTFAQVLEEADELVRVCRDVHAHGTRTGFVDKPRRIELELNGWGPEDGAIPRYRWVAGRLRGETQGGRVERDTALPSSHLSFGNRVVIKEGLLHLRDIPGFAEALARGDTELRQPLDPQLIPPIARGLPPGSGVKIVSAWACVPASSLSTMIQSIRAYVLAMRT